MPETRGGDTPDNSLEVRTEEPGEPCDNCLRPDRDLMAVRRSYVVPEAWDRAGSATTLDEAERWCPSCRVTYPHEPAG